MMKNVSIVFLAWGIAACGTETNESAPMAVENSLPSIEVRPETLTVTMPVEGSVEARHRTVLSTRLMARVDRIQVEVGDLVRRGQTLMRLGSEDIAANRAKAEAGVLASQAARDEAARQAARADTLYAQDAVPRVRLDQARLALTQAESQLAMAHATLAEVETADRYARISAPFNGAVVQRHINEGDIAGPGAPLLTVEATGAREAVFALPADVAQMVEVGSPITVVARNGLRARSVVRAVAAGADPMTRTVLVRTTLSADWPTGIAVTGLVPMGERMGIAIPSDAVVRRGQLTGVRVVTTHGNLLRWVRLGRSVTVGSSASQADQQRVEVLSGLGPGDRIVP